MKIVFLTDSYGGPRIFGGVADVAPQQTYPELVRSAFAGKDCEIIIDYLSFRKVTELPALLPKYPAADLYILQAGVVDVYPRVISHSTTISQAFFPKLIRRVIRMRRRFFIKYVRNKPWSDRESLVAAVNEITGSVSTNVLWVNVAPVNDQMESDSPGANRMISDYNQLLKSMLNGKARHSILDVHALLRKQADLGFYLHPGDSHLNIEGNRLYADAIGNYIKQMSVK